MDQPTYTIAALATESKPETLKISLLSLDMTLAIGMAAGEVMNKIKRAMFYGKPVEKEELVLALEQLAQTAMCMGELTERDLLQDQAASDDMIKIMHGAQPGLYETASLHHINKRLLHGVIGEMSETAEKFDALRFQLYGKGFDIVNFAEELGDNEWYTAIQYDELAVLARAEADAKGEPVPFDVSQAAVRARNIAKLAARNKGKTFNAEATINRDTDAERVILESNDVQKITVDSLQGVGSTLGALSTSKA